MEPRIDLGEIPVFEERQDWDIQSLDLTALESDADGCRSDGLRHRLQRMYTSTLVVRMPVGMKVIELVHP